MSVRILAFMLLLTVTTALGILAQPAAAQTATPLPTITPTASPYTPTITLTPSSTPTPLPTLAALLPDREVITLGNASQIKKYREWQAHAGFVAGIAFIPHTTRLVTVGIEESDPDIAIPMRLWDIQKNHISEVKNFFEGIPAYQSYGMYDLSLSPDGTRIVAGGYGSRVWDAKTGRITGQVFQDHAGIQSLASDNQTLVIGSYDLVALWSIPAAIPSDNTEMGPLPEDFVFSPQGSLKNSFHAGEQINQVAFNADSYQVFVLTQTGRLLIYQPINDIDYSLTVVPQAPLSSAPSAFAVEGGRLMDINHDRHEITYSDSNWDIVVYNFEQNEIVARYPLGKPTLCLNYSPDGKLLLLTDWDFTTKLQLFDTSTHEKIAEIVTGKAVTRCAFSWDSTFIATGDNEGQLALWGIPSS